MASGSLFEAFVTLSVKGASQAKAELASVEAQGERTGSKLKSMGASIGGAGKTMTAFVTGPLLAMGAGMAKLSIDAEETASKFGTVFGKSTGEMNNFIKETMKVMPATRQELQAMTSEMQDLLVPFGVAPKRAKEMTKGLTTLIGDMASFNNLGTADVQRDVQSALAGSSEALLKYGVDTSVAALETYAYEKGIAKKGEELTRAQKAEAIYGKLLQDTTKAQGDMARTAGSTANQLKFLWRDTKELATTLGNSLKPAISLVAGVMSGLLARTKNMSPAVQRVVVLVGAFVAALGPLLIVLGLILSGIAPIIGVIAGAGGLSAAFGLAAAAVGSFLVAAAPFVAVIAALVAGAALLIANWSKVKAVFAPLVPIINRVKQTLGNLGAVIKGLFTGNTGTEAFRKAFTSLPGPIQNAIKTIIVAWWRLKGAFSQVRAAVMPILKQIGNGIKTGLVAAFKFLIRQGQQLVAWFKSNWPQIKTTTLTVVKAVASALKTGLGSAFKFIVTQGKRLITWTRENWPQIKTTVLAVVKAVGSAVRIVLGGAFKFALQNGKIIVNWFKQNWPLIQRTVSTVMKLVVSRIRTGFNLLKSIISTVVGAIVLLWGNNWTEIKSILQSVWRIIKSVVQTAIRNVLNILKLGMQVITGDWRGAWKTVKTILSDNWENIKTIVREALRILGNVIKIAWNNIKAISKAAFNAVRDYIESRLETAKERATEILKSLGEAIFDRYESMKRSAKAAFEAIKGFMVSPIESAYNGIKDWVGKILGVVNTVLKAVGLDEIKLEGSVESPGGNGSSGRGSRPARVVRGFRRGGIATERFHRGGVGTSTPQPKTHMWNEQMGNEAFIAEREPSKTQMPYLKAAAGWHGMDVVPRRSTVPSHRGGPDGTEENSGVHKHARGGISGLVRAFAYGGFGKEYYNSAASALDQAVMSRFPVDGSSYSGHPAGAVDFLVSSGQAQGQEKALGDSVAGWLDSNYGALNLRALIWYARARYEGGPWQPYVDNYGGGSGDVASQMHYNHPHAESLSGSFGKLNEDQTKGFTGGGGGGGGGMVENLKLALFNKLWDSTVQPVADRFLKPLKDADYVMSNAVGAAGQKIPDGIKEWALSQPVLAGGSGGSSGPGGSTQDPGQGGDNRAIGERMLKASGVPGSFSSLNSLWTKESQWDHKAQNPTSTAFGIPQFLDTTWAQYGGKETEPTPQIDKGLQYIRDRYGNTDDAWGHSQANNWYSAGGMTKGAQRAVIGEAGPELVLPLNNQRVMQSAQTALGTARLQETFEREMRGLRRDMTEAGIKVSDYGPRASETITVGAREGGLGAIRSNAGQKAQRDNQRSNDDSARRRGRN